MLHTGLRARGRAWHSQSVNVAFGWRGVLVVLFVCSLLIPGLQSARAASDAYVSTDSLFLRSDPSSDAEILDEMAFGAYLAVIDGPADGNWYFVDFQGTQGWASGDYLSFGNAPEASVGGSGGTVWVATDALNVRTDADQSAGILGIVGQGDQLQVVGDSINGYYPVEFAGTTGWVAAEFLSWAPVGSGSENWISVDRSSSTIALMVGDDAVATYTAQMGMDDSADGYYATALGTYYVFVKNADLTYTKYAKGYITYWVGFDPERANGFHSWLLDKNGYFLEGGDGPTGGCVSLEPTFAQAVYEFATVGMRVEVHW
jgi:uncharacterized protein YgiM (DUF1202 family)